MGIEVAFKDNTKAFLALNKAKRQQALDNIGKYVNAVIKGETPVLSGILRDSNTYKVTGDTVLFINDAEYAGYVELGTMYMFANPFIRRSLAKSEKASLGILASNLKV